MNELEINADDYSRKKVLDILSYAELAIIVADRLQGIKKNIDAMNELLKKHGLKIGVL